MASSILKELDYLLADADHFDMPIRVEDALKAAKAEIGKVAAIHDQLFNGITYDQATNQYVLTWTKRQIENARKEADELYKAIHWESPTAP